ncbi:MAG: DUF4296 domain-containing protein [Bacteroidales bacterium]|nr:DUF4296 domain-containing protein [Bacteroidales bacterium]
MKRSLYILIAIVLVCFASCKSKKQVLDKPEGLINRSTMVKIIADSYIIESTVHLSADTISKSELAQKYYKELFQRYNITREQFVSSINYYVSEESSAEKLLSDASKLIEKKRESYHIPAVSEDKTNSGAGAVDIASGSPSVTPGLDTIRR